MPVDGGARVGGAAPGGAVGMAVSKGGLGPAAVATGGSEGVAKGFRLVLLAAEAPACVSCVLQESGALMYVVSGKPGMP